MQFNKKMLQLYAITDRHWVGKLTLLEQIELVLKNGATCLQLREKHLSKEDFILEALEVKKLCNKYNVPLIINDNVDIAIEVGADGVHIGQEDLNAHKTREKVGKNMIVGVSAHNVKEAQEALKNGADYVGIGASFVTTTKDNEIPMSEQTMKDICKYSNIPTVAIGGINLQNAMQLKNRGIDGIAVISALFGAEDIAKATKELKEISYKLVHNE